MLHSRHLFILLLSLVAFTAEAHIPESNELKGRITDSLGNPIISAVVTVPDLKLGTATDDRGDYIIRNMHKGNYLVQVYMIGFSTITTTVYIEGETVRNFTLSESIIERSELVITGTSLATEQRKSPTPITSISLNELQENASTNVVDAISKLPGVSQTTTGPAISKPVIRGLGSNRILTINDGIRQEGQQWGDEHGIEIDDYNVSKIEVLKGPASLAYGSDALAGVVNIISEEHYPKGKIKGDLSLNYQTNSGLAVAHANIGGNKNGVSWSAYATLKAAHDYKNKYDGYVFNSRFNNANFGVLVGLNRRWGYSRLSFTSFNQKVGIAEGDRDSATGNFLKLVNIDGAEGVEIVTSADGRSYNMQVPWQKLGHQKIAWNNNIYLNNGGRIGVNLGFQQNIRREYEDVLDPDVSGLHFLLKTYSYDIKYFLKPLRDWQLTAGINGMRQDNVNKGTEFLIPDYQLFDLGAYVLARRDFGKLSVSGGVRYDSRSLTSEALYLDSLDERTSTFQEGGLEQFTAFKRDFSNLTGSIGMSYLASRRTTFKLNIARGFRAPNIAELSANGVHEGTIRYEYGNIGLKAESSVQADLGMEYNAEHIYINASVFYNHVSNFIFIRKLLNSAGNDSIPGINNEEAYPAFVFAQQDAALYGGELYIDLHPHPLDWLHFDNTFSYVRGKINNGTDSMQNLPMIPPARWLIELRVQKNKLAKRLSNGYLKLGVDINFDQQNIFSAFNTETPTDGYALLNAGLGFDLTNKRSKTICSVILSGQNILDRAYQNHLSRLKYAPNNLATGRKGIFGMGRNISVMLNFPLQF